MKMQVKRSMLRTIAGAGRCIRPQGGLLILYYHSISPVRRYETNVTPDAFHRQMAYLRTARRVVPLLDAVSSLARGQPCTGQAVVTFDDGYRDNRTCALPVLQEFGVPATIFLTVGYVGTDRLLPHDVGDDPAANRLLTRDDVSAMEGPLISFGSHTMTHCRLSRAAGAAEAEIAESMNVLRVRLRARQIPFSYPYGTSLDFLPDHAAMVRRAGFACGCSAMFGENTPQSDLFALRRVGVDSSDDEVTFRAKVDGALWFLSIKDSRPVKRVVRALMG